MSNTQKTNFFNLQNYDVQDAKTEQNYLNSKIEEAAKYISLGGATRIDGATVVEDSVIAEPFAFPTVPQSDARPELQNFRTFPIESNITDTSQLYSVFQAKSNNIQRIDLKMQLVGGEGNSTVLFQLRKLKNGEDPSSELSQDILFSKLFQESDLPDVNSDGLLTIDLSGTNNRAGVTTTRDHYYAIVINFVKESNSLDQLRIFHSNATETSAINSALHSWIYVGTRFQQGLYNEEAVLEKFTIYHKVYAAAVKINPGVLYDLQGKPVRIEENQFRYLGLTNRGSSKPKNYVTIQFKEETAGTEKAARTGNLAVNRIADSSTASIISQAEFDAIQQDTTLKAKTVILAEITDKNVINFRHEESVTIDENANLIYKDWLNPCSEIPSVESLEIVEKRPQDLVFFVSNIPTTLYLLNSKGERQYDDLGSPIYDPIEQVMVDLKFGDSVRSFEMGVMRETETEPSYRSYFMTLTPPDTELEVSSYNYLFDVNEITPTTVFNFRIVTASKNTIYIQDYDKSVKTTNPETGELTDTRERKFEVRVDKGDITIPINEDLKLGEQTFASGILGQEVVERKVSYQKNETPTEIGLAASEKVVARVDTLQASDNYQFSPVPIATRDLQQIVDTDASVQEAYTAGDLTIYVDDVDIAYSGNSTTKGGNGNPHTIFGTLDFSGASAYIGAEVKIRNANGKDNTQQTQTYLVEKDNATGDIVFKAVAMGRGDGSDAGFADNEDMYIYIEDRAALDATGIKITIPYQPFGATSTVAFDLDTKQYFRGKTIVSASDHTVNGVVTPDPGTVAIDPVVGMVYFPSGEEPSGITTIRFLHLDRTYKQIDAYQTLYNPFGTKTRQKINNTDDSVRAAIYNLDITVKVDGKSIIDPTFSGAGAADIVADMQTTALADNTVSINPLTGKIVFADDIKPSTSSSVTVSYYRLQEIYVSTVSQSLETYEQRYDFDGDGRIEEDDLAVFEKAFGSVKGQPEYNADADFDSDGRVDQDDYDEFMRHFALTQSGGSDYLDATAIRLKTILVYNKDNPNKKLNVTKAVSREAKTGEDFGYTILFLDKDDVITEPGNYVVQFGWFAGDTGYGQSEITVTTEVPFAETINYNSIEVTNPADSTFSTEVFDKQSTTRTVNNKTVYDTTFTFTPPIRTSGTYIFKATWRPNQLAVRSRRDFIGSVEFEENMRKKFGPFKLNYRQDGYAQDGSSINVEFEEPDAVFSTGTVDTTGLHIGGVPIEKMKFKAFLFIPRDDDSGIVDQWQWCALSIDPYSKRIKLQNDEALLLEHRTQGRFDKNVLQPFGLAQYQATLKPKYAGGDLENDLSNLYIVRDTNCEETNEITSLSADKVIFPDDVCGFYGKQTLSQIICNIFQEIDDIGDIYGCDDGMVIATITGSSTGYGGTQKPIRVPVINQKDPNLQQKFSPCAVSVAHARECCCSMGDYYYYDRDDNCLSMECVEIKVGKKGCGYFEIEYWMPESQPCQNYDGIRNVYINWSAVGDICTVVEPAKPKRPPITDIVSTGECTFHFVASAVAREGVIVSYNWDLGDGVHTSTQREFDFTYDEPGTYVVTLIATDSSGNTSSDSVVVVVSAG